MKAGRVKWQKFWGSYFMVCYHCPQNMYTCMRVYGTAAEAYNALITHYVHVHE